MTGRGLRILSLDGGGTRGLSTMYALQEILDRVQPGNRGNIRPAEYFDVIGGVGPNGLAAMLFCRFNCTINQVLEFYHDLSQRLDDVEATRSEEGGELYTPSTWQEVLDENEGDPAGQLAQIRQRQVQDIWKGQIQKYISDALERWPHQQGGTFDYKMPMAEVGVARCKGIVLGSETRGYGVGAACMETDRQYHVPMLHRTYDARGTRTYYTFYAVGLGTVAVPDVMKSGVVFPMFLTTGHGNQQNPIHQLLEECNRVFPGLKPGILLSLGTGKLDAEITRETFNFDMHPFEWDCVETCAKMHETNAKVADEIEQYILPYDKQLKSAYYRFDLPTPIPYFESYNREQISSATRAWMASGPVEAKLAKLSRALGYDSWPETTEDHVALASLGSLLEAFLVNGYAKEREVVADIIANYILYEGASSEEENIARAGIRRNTQAEKKRKLMIAMTAEELAYMVRNRRQFTHENITLALQQGLYPAAYFLDSALAYGSRNVHAKELASFSDYTAGSHFLVKLVEKNDEEELSWPVFRRLKGELSFLVGSGGVPRLPGYGDSQYQEEEDDASITPAVLRRVGFLCELSSMAALCRAATMEGLKGEPQLFNNGALMRHVCHTISTESVAKYAVSILAPIADFLALHMELKSWSHCYDDVIENLLWAVSPRNVGTNQVAFTVDHWSLVNLAVARLKLASETPDHETDPEVAELCNRVCKACNEQWKSVQENPDIMQVCLERGHSNLLWKAIDSHDLLTPFSEFYQGQKIREVIDKLTAPGGNTLLHQVCELGYPKIAKNLMNYLGIGGSEEALTQGNSEGKTPLMLVAENRSADHVLILCLILKSKVDQQCNQGKTALHYCFPPKNSLPEYFSHLKNNLVRDHALLTTARLDSCKLFGEYGAPGGKPLDTRAHSFRQIIHRLVIRGADFSLADNTSATPLHVAAREGWGDNMNLFFCHRSEKIDDFMKEAMKHRDNKGKTVLQLSKLNGEESGEHIVEKEMKKRDIEPEEDPPSPVSPVTPVDAPAGLRVVQNPGAAWNTFAQDLARGLNMPVENVRIVQFDPSAAQQTSPQSPPIPTPPLTQSPAHSSVPPSPHPPSLHSPVPSPGVHQPVSHAQHLQNQYQPPPSPSYQQQQQPPPQHYQQPPQQYQQPQPPQQYQQPYVQQQQSPSPLPSPQYVYTPQQHVPPQQPYHQHAPSGSYQPPPQPYIPQQGGPHTYYAPLQPQQAPHVQQFLSPGQPVSPPIDGSDSHSTGESGSGSRRSRILGAFRKPGSGK